MKNIINLLPDSIANQIAAGEVVQRPASALKELLENSIDSKSTEIKVIIKNAGKNLIQVIDNGIGMSEVDARMCFERHATSKIKTQEDLFNINTLGFRGEALASIAAIAQVELETNLDASGLGTKIIIEASEVISQKPIAVPKGTKIAVKNLFFNVPARRNFLKSNVLEMKYLVDEFIKIALSNPEIAFYLYNENTEIYHLPKTKLSHRIVHIFGKNYQNQLLECKEDTEYVKINGFIGKPEYSKKTRGEQFFFVNNRFVKSPYLNHAIKSVFENLVQDKYFPFYVLFINIDPKHIDINVHPSKAEIKFDDEKSVYSILKAAIQKSISSYHIAPSIDFEQNVNSGEIKILEKVQENLRQSFNDQKYQSFKNYDDINKRKLDWEELIRDLDNDSSQAFATQGSIINETKPSKIEENYSNKKLQVHNKYLVTQIESGLIIIDQNAAHRRILYEKYMAEIKNNSGSSQQLIFPSKIKFIESDFLVIKECFSEISNLGFKIELPKEQSTEILIKGIPSEVAYKDPKILLEGLIEQFVYNNKLSIEKSDNIARSLANKSAIYAGQLLTTEEISSLIARLFACENPLYTPEGDIIFKKIYLKELEEMFEK